ncbi:MAG TPA: hypothetical protein VHU40_00445 [Polyangia bacterium]|nr:hypothetical protein [Polyangia bacterium]
MLALLAFPLAARAQSASAAPTERELTFDVDAASVTISLATRLSDRLSVGAGAGGGLSPILGATWARGTHYDAAPNVHLLDVVGAQGFVRLALLPWLRVDTGLRAALFVHGQEDFTAGQSLSGYVMPSFGWRWLSIGTRVSAGWLREGQSGTAAALALDFLIVRVSMVTTPR